MSAPGYVDPRVTRTVSADVLETQPGFLDPYPYRYVLVIALSRPHAFAQLSWAVEMLEYRGWELTGWKPSDHLWGPGAYTTPGRGAPAGPAVRQECPDACLCPGHGTLAAA